MPDPLINFTVGPSCFYSSFFYNFPFMSNEETKPYKTIEELVELLIGRGMLIDNPARAAKKLSQVGYYRLSGFWYPCRKPKYDEHGEYAVDPVTKTPVRKSDLQEGVSFDHIFSLYLFDKKLRFLLLDAIERIEIQIRSIIAHEMGGHDPLAYLSSDFTNPQKIKNKQWTYWSERSEKHIKRSRTEHFVKWHINNGKPLPIWAVIECWDFGLMSTYYTNLKREYQIAICEKVGFSQANTFGNWLSEINTIRNKCAHHSRIWNYTASNPISKRGTAGIEYFDNLNLDEETRKKLYSHISVIWFLVKNIGPSSDWLLRVADLIDEKPNIPCCPFTAMGFSDNTGFPRHLFDLPPKA